MGEPTNDDPAAPEAPFDANEDDDEGTFGDSDAGPEPDEDVDKEENRMAAEALREAAAKQADDDG